MRSIRLLLLACGCFAAVRRSDVGMFSRVGAVEPRLRGTGADILLPLAVCGTLRNFQILTAGLSAVGRGTTVPLGTGPLQCQRGQGRGPNQRVSALRGTHGAFWEKEEPLDQ